MKAGANSDKSARPEEKATAERLFKNVGEANAYFFPKNESDRRQMSGQDQGVELAEDALAEISKSLEEAKPAQAGGN